MSSFNINNSIKSRYSVSNVSSNTFQQILSGSTNNYPLATLISGGTYTQGYIFAPYVPINIDDINNAYKIELLRQCRKEKLNKLGW